MSTISGVLAYKLKRRNHFGQFVQSYYIYSDIIYVHLIKVIVFSLTSGQPINA